MGRVSGGLEKSRVGPRSSHRKHEGCRQWLKVTWNTKMEHKIILSNEITNNQIIETEVS